LNLILTLNKLNHIFSLERRSVIHKLKSLLILVLLLSAPIFSQNFYRITLPAGDSVSNPIKLGKNEIPAAIYADSLTASTSVGFYVYIGDTAGTDITDWYRLGSASDSTWYAAALKAKIYTPLNPAVFFSVISDPFLYSNKAAQIWLFLVARTTQTNAKYVWLKTRYY